MVNAILGSGYDLVQRLNVIENRLRDLATQPVLLHASTGQDGGQGLSTDKDGLHLFNPAGVENVTLATADGSATFGGDVTASGNMNVTGTLTASNASITGNISQTNSYGAMAGGPALRVNSSPGVTFTKAGTTYAQNTGMSLSKNYSNANDILLLQGPATTTNYAYLALQDSGAISLGSISTGPIMQSTDGSANGTMLIYGGQSNGSVNLSASGTGNVQVYGNFAVTGSKAFIMDHPLHPDTMTLMHAATESPVNGVEYWGTATADSTGHATVTLPGYFEALTRTTGRNVQLTPNGPCTTAPWASAIAGGQFTINAPSGMIINWLVKAERQRIVDGHDDLAFPPEIDKMLIGPRLP